MTANIPRIMLAGTGSGCGKTMVTSAVLGALSNRKLFLRSYKCGPDYIDPMFHSKILGVPCRNLDSFLCPEETVRYLFARNTPEGCLGVVEGVMGYYDGLSGTETTASSHHISTILEMPVILVVHCKGKSLSVAAEIKGYMEFQPNGIRGVILNGVSEYTYPMYKKIIQENTGTEVLGYMPFLKDSVIESRHLGLVASSEIIDLRKRMTLLANQAEQSINIDRLVEIAREAPSLEYRDAGVSRMETTVRIGVAMDSAFSFYYKDSLDLLEMLGARLVAFSPSSDPDLPDGISGLLLGGGYPELNAYALSSNEAMRAKIKKAVLGGMPTVAECGGFLYLCKELRMANGTGYEMAGVLDNVAWMAERLGNFGYVTLTARKGNLLCEAGEQIQGHEFHYSRTKDDGDAYIAAKHSGKSWDTIYATDTYYAGYPHLHFWSNPNMARRFLKRCLDYRRV